MATSSIGNGSGGVQESGVGVIAPAGQGAQESGSKWDVPTRAFLRKAYLAMLEPGGSRAGPLTECLSGFGCASEAAVFAHHPIAALAFFAASAAYLSR